MASARPRATSSGTTPGVDQPLRVIFAITVAERDTEQFLAAYDAISERVADVPGHVEDQVARSTERADRWIITSLWDTAGAFARWERSPEHRALVRPLRACFTDPQSLRFEVRRTTRR